MKKIDALTLNKASHSEKTAKRVGVWLRGYFTWPFRITHLAERSEYRFELEGIRYRVGEEDLEEVGAIADLSRQMISEVLLRSLEDTCPKKKKK